MTRKVIARRRQRDRPAAFVRLRKAPERAVPPDKAIEAAIDNAAPHRHPDRPA
ncbi:MAG: hypothetical protein ABSC95_13520 [Acetobacteraceae bacterium]|jgi:hypothetical protein